MHFIEKLDGEISLRPPVLAKLLETIERENFEIFPIKNSTMKLIRIRPPAVYDYIIVICIEICCLYFCVVGIYSVPL